MNLLNMDSEPFEFETALDDFSDEYAGACSECGSDLELSEHAGQCSKCDSEFEFNEVELDLDDLELEEEIKRGKSSFRRSSGRRSRPARRLSPRVKKSPRPKRRPLRPSGALRPKPKRRRHRPGKRPIFIRPRRRRPVVIREPADPCVCPAHGTEFVRWVQSSLNQISGLRLGVNGVMNRATRDAVRNFQKRESLPVDGIAGPETERALVDAKNRMTPTGGELELSNVTSQDDDDYPYREPEEEFSFSDFPKAILKALRKGLEKVAVALAFRFGTRDENKLADLVFFGRHPERSGRLLKKGERNFKSLRLEWVRIRDLIVRPIVSRSFFAEYELRFHPGKCSFCIGANTNMSKTAKTQRNEDVFAMVSDSRTNTPGELLIRRNIRASAALKRKLVPSAPLPRDPAPSSLHSIARRLSDAQLGLFKEFFPNSSGGINFKAFQFAFELFANGELRDSKKGKGFGEPDGGIYFLFAEFAFLCIDSKIDKTVWAKALKTFVKTQEIFMHIYRPPPHAMPPSVGTRLPKPGMARKLRDFDHSNFDPLGRSDEKRKRKLRAKYDRMGVRALSKAARDNLIRAQRM